MSRGRWRRAIVTCPPPPPAQPEALVHCSRVSWEEKVGSLRSAPPPRGGLLISLPVEQQLLELKPNGSNDGNCKIPTLSSCRQGRRGALRSSARDAAIRPLGCPLPRWTRCGCAVHPSRRGKRRRDQGRPQAPVARPTPTHARTLAPQPRQTFPARAWQNTYCGKPVATGYL